MSKLWLCGICQDNEKEVNELLDMASGRKTDCQLLFIDGGSKDETIKTIMDWGGLILRRKWTNDHDFQMNTYIRSGLIEHGDWIIQIDMSERIHPDFIDRLNNGMLENFEKQGINTVYQRSKVLLFKYYDDQIYSGNPHWGIIGQRQHMVDISKFDGFEDDKTYFWSLRDNINKWIVNGIKYYLVYGRSNHMSLVYHPSNYPQSSPNLIQEHEQNRQRFRNYCRTILKLDFNSGAKKLLESFDTYLKEENFDKDFIEFMNYEKTIANYYRYLMGEDQKIIFNTQNTWQF